MPAGELMYSMEVRGLGEGVPEVRYRMWWLAEGEVDFYSVVGGFEGRPCCKLLLLGRRCTSLLLVGWCCRVYVSSC